MKIRRIEPPRSFRAGINQIEIRDCAHIELDADEQVTFKTPQGGQFDVARKSWGFYATPSLDGRLPSFGLRPALVRNCQQKHYVLLCEKGCQTDWEAYLRDEQLTVVGWLDDPATLQQIHEALTGTTR
jgi:hypothetical protein